MVHSSCVARFQTTKSTGSESGHKIGKQWASSPQDTLCADLQEVEHLTGWSAIPTKTVVLAKKEMKRERESEEEGGAAEEPVSKSDSDLEQSAAAEMEADDSGHQESASNSDEKRLKLQKKLKKLKQTYENRGRHYCHISW